MKEILNIIFKRQGDQTSYNIVWEIRLPRILAVIILGGALSVSGFLLQTFFNNPIAGPFVLGISSGAKLVVALLMIFLLSRSVSIGSGGMILAAFAGSMIAMGFVLLVAKKVHNMSMLVISGVMIGYICSAVTDFVVTFADDSNIVNLHNWSLGSFSGMTWGKCKNYGSGSTGRNGDRIFYVKTHQRVSVGRDLRPEHGSEYQAVPDISDTAFQYSFCLCYCFCRTDLICWNRGSPYCKSLLKTAKPILGDSGLLPGRCGVLPVLRPDRKDSFCANRAQYQFCDSCIWSTGGYLYYDSQTAEDIRDEIIFFFIQIS
mgnify:CR=1 FL=1